MRYIQLFALCLLASCQWFKSEDVANQLLIDSRSMQTIYDLEKELGGELSYYSGKVNPKFCPEVVNCDAADRYLTSIRRSEDLPLIAKYFFDKDSVVQFVHYEWSKTVPPLNYEEREQIMAQEVNNFPAYMNKLNLIAEKVHAEFGEPIYKDEGLQEGGTSLLDFKKYKIIYKKDGQVVELRLLWSPQMGARFFKVIAKVYWE